MKATWTKGLTARSAAHIVRSGLHSSLNATAWMKELGFGAAFGDPARTTSGKRHSGELPRRVGGGTTWRGDRRSSSTAGRLGEGEAGGSRCHGSATRGGGDQRPGVVRRGWSRGRAHHGMNGGEIVPQTWPVAMRGAWRTPAQGWCGGGMALAEGDRGALGGENQGLSSGKSASMSGEEVEATLGSEVAWWGNGIAMVGLIGGQG
jgi:hypothetical protein